MKLGLIFKKEFHDKYGEKQVFYGDEITIRHEFDWLVIELKDEGFSSFLAKAIQLIYLGEWNK